MFANTFCHVLWPVGELNAHLSDLGCGFTYTSCNASMSWSCSQLLLSVFTIFVYLCQQQWGFCFVCGLVWWCGSWNLPSERWFINFFRPGWVYSLIQDAKRSFGETSEDWVGGKNECQCLVQSSAASVASLGANSNTYEVMGVGMLVWGAMDVPVLTIAH